MSKKKVSSTMSLKDFHGGSIPSDLPLPSAPGVPGSDRSPSANWGNNLMRADLRPRPKSSGASRGFDEKASLLSHPSPPIGRNFDEDERKPLDGLSAPRRTISDESIQRSVKLDYPSSVRVHDRPLSSPGIQSPSLGTGLRSVAGSAGIASGVLNGQGVNYNPPNAWGVKKEVSEYVAPSPLGTSPISKLAQASAIDKVSSGMWQSKNPTNLLPHLLYAKDNVVAQSGGMIERGGYDPPHGIQNETDLLTEDRNREFGREYPSYGIDQSHRPKASSPKQGPIEGKTNTRAAEKPVERPKLNLKPRSQPLEQSEGNAVRERYIFCPNLAQYGCDSTKFSSW
ncbi:unnamed protein product [Linum tenue]|uniref:Uncharacterized protein n=1 Tax=Linum tenue TaxID=586396 RepID=A0AAV0NR80_9ROSI|nr:unnamed protein product [Linum tenue]